MLPWHACNNSLIRVVIRTFLLVSLRSQKSIPGPGHDNTNINNIYTKAKLVLSRSRPRGRLGEH